MATENVSSCSDEKADGVLELESALTCCRQPGKISSLMFTRIGRCVVALALCSSIGGHWLGLQSIAWATMIANYSQHCSFGQAIVQTFDGKHPCDLCKHISKAKATEKKQDNQRGATKVDLICIMRQCVLLPPFIPFDYSELIASPGCHSQQPLSPPPRTQFA